MLLVACATQRLYEGPVRPPEGVAVLHKEGSRASISVARIDGREVSGRSWEMLPGRHTVEAEVQIHQSFESGGAITRSWFRMPCVAEFTASAGRRYLVRGHVEEAGEGALQKSFTLGIWIADETAPEVQLGTYRCFH